jgi:hypothetical protein
MVAEQTFSVACVALYTRLWADLDALAEAERAAPRDALEAAELLRLELLILADSCQSPRWRTVLSATQRLALKSVVTDVLAALDRPVDELSMEAISQAQNRLFDEIVGCCAPQLAEGMAPARRTAT